MKSKEQKRKEAEERQKEYNSLSTEEKIKRAENRRGNSTKELNKLKGVTK